MLEERVGDGAEPSAYAGESGAVDGGQVLDATLAVEKLKAGTIGAQTIIMNGSSSILKSSNYIAGSSGWQIRGDGSAEFSDVTVRGTLNASDLVAGTINDARFGVDTIGSDPVKPGALFSTGYLAETNLNIAYESSSTNIWNISVAPYTNSSLINLPANPNRTSVLLVGCIYSNQAITSTFDPNTGAGLMIAAIIRTASGLTEVITNNWLDWRPINLFNQITMMFIDRNPPTVTCSYRIRSKQKCTTGGSHNVNSILCIQEFSKGA
jgi:hypothetical protein